MPFFTAIRLPYRAAVRSIAVVSVAVLLQACALLTRPPEDLDYSRTRQSAGGAYRATIRPQGDSIPRGKLHTWTLHLETTDGLPVVSAGIAVDGGMPRHGHGLPTKPRAREIGDGDYAVEGMKFNMGGWWVVKFRVHSGAASDSIVFDLKL